MKRNWFSPNRHADGSRREKKTWRKRDFRAIRGRRLMIEPLEHRNLLSISTGTQFGGINENMASWYPLQINAAAGPNYVVDVAGGDVAIFSHSGQLIQNKPITNFTGGSGDNPTVVYDPTVAGGGRYIICSGVSTVYFGISNTSDPTQGWHYYTLSFPSSGDGGRFGFNNSAYFVWYSAGGNPNTVVIQKSSILTAGGSMVSYTQNSPGHPTLQVDDTATYGTGAGDPAWFYSTTQLIKETNYLSSNPTYTTYSISGGTFASSKYAEIRTIAGVQTIAGVSDNASITWAVNGVTSLYWSEVNVATAAVIQSGNIATPSGWTDMGYAYSSLAPNGDIGITFMDATAGGTEMGMFITGRKFSDPAGTMNVPIAAFTGTYDFTRVGDYGTVNADPTDNTFWATEYSDSDPGYTAISNFGLTNAPAAAMQPVLGFGAAPSDGTNVNLQWNAVPGATSYQLERSSDGVTYTRVVSGLTGTSFTDVPGGTVSGLYYEILAFNGQNDSAAPSPIQVTLAPTQTYNALSAPTGLTAALAATGSGVALSWNSVSNGSGYFVWRSTSGATWTLIGTITSAGTTTFSDTGLAGSQLCYYRVSTRDSSGGQSVPSAVATISNRPSAPIVSVNTGWSNQMQVAWNLIPSATSYTVLRSTDGSNYTTIGTTAADYVTYTDFTVSPNTKYYYQVVANNPLGSSTAGTASAASYLPTPTGLMLTQGAGSLALQWTAVTGATGYQIQRSTDNSNFSPIATTSAAGYTDTSVVPLTPYYYRVYAVSSANGNTSDPATVFSAAPPLAPLPYLWQSQDIGASNIGASGFAAGVYTVDGYGGDIWGTSDQFHFTSLPVTGNVTIVAQVNSQSNTGGWAKAGVMIRNSLAANSQYALECITPSNGSAFQYRTTTDGGAGGSGGNSGPIAPYWVKLVKTNNTITGYRSADGNTWTSDGSVSITMGSTIYVGLAADSNWNMYSKLIDNLPPGSTPAISAATFSNVVVTTSNPQPPTVAVAASASPNPVTGTTANLSVLGSDATGQANLYYTWTATSLPAGAAQPTFSANGTNAAQNTTATFNRAGAYTLQATITNTYGLKVTSSVSFTVNQTLTGITITPLAAIVNVSSTQQFTAYGADQFGQPIPGSISATWSISPTSGAGSINSSSGLYTSPGTQVTATITAVSGGKTASAAVQVFNRDLFTNPAGGSWTTAGNWQTSTIASGAGAAADFGTLGLSSAPTVTLDGARTVGDLLFGDTNNSYGWTINTGTGGPLTLSTSSGTPTIVVTNQSAMIGAALAGTQGFTMTGVGTLTLSASNNYSGTTTISGGKLIATAGGWYTTRSIGSGSLVVNAGASAEFTVAHGFGYGNGGEPATLNGGTLIFDHENYVSSLSMTGGTLQGAGETRPATNLTVTVNASPNTSTISNPTNLGYGNINFNVASGTAAPGLLVSGLISGGDNITKSGAGIAVFSNTNSYTGTTTISAGALWANNTGGWAIGSGAVAVNSGGTLGGTGAVAGPVTVNSGGTLAPGAGGIGTLTINNTLALHGATAMEISKGSGTPSGDLVAGVTSLTFGGTLTVTNLAGALAAGDSFTLFSANSYSGNFSAINLPTLGANLVWDTSGLASCGTIKIYGPPSVATPAAAVLQTGNKTVALSVLGSDPAGESNLTYTWTASPSTGVTFTPNGTNASKVSTATLTAAGSYTFTVTITNSHNLSVTSFASLAVNQALTSIAVSPATANITAGATQQFAATAYDQFGAAIANSSFTWAIVTGAGSIGPTSGLYTPPYAPVATTVQATDEGVMSNVASVTVTGQAQWNSSADASWSTGGSWKDSISGTTIAAPGLRGISGDSVLFADANGGTAQLDGSNPTLAGIVFNNPETSYTIAAGSGGSLNLSGGASVSVLAGSHQIAAPAHLAGGVAFSEAAGSALTISGAIDGGGSIVQDGPGTMTLSGVNSYSGPTQVNGGTLIVASPASLPDGSSLTVGGDAASFFSNSPPAASFPSTASPAAVFTGFDDLPPMPAGSGPSSSTPTNGNVYYGPVPGPAPVKLLNDTPTYTTLANGMPVLHSRPEAPATIYMDLSSYDEDNASPPYDGTYSATEAAHIAEGWRQLAMYYSMFDVDVTTIQPANLSTQPTAWAHIGNDISGGYTYVGTFPNSSPESFNEAGDLTGRVSGIAHEVGHNFGNSHQRAFDWLGNQTAEYIGASDNLHGPIMGVDYDGFVHKWFVGRIAAATLQDDMATIYNQIKNHAPAGYTGDGYATDDYGNDIAHATPLTANSGAFVATGIIERLNDTDAFSFTSSGGRYEFAAEREAPSGVDTKLSVYDSSGNLLASTDGSPAAQPLTNVDDSFLDLDLPAGAASTYYVLVGSHGNYDDQGQYHLLVTPLASGWSSREIGFDGQNAAPGYVSYDSSSSTFTEAASTGDVWNTSDNLIYAYQTLQGNGSITAQVTYQDNTAGWAKAGVMIRSSLDAGAQQAFTMVTPSNGADLQYRGTVNGSSTSVSGPSAIAPYWVRLTRSGNTFTSSVSVDGTTWTTVGSTSIAMGTTVYIGLADCANNNGTQNYSMFSSVSLTGTINPATAANSPASLTTTAATSSSISLSWASVSGATGYVIERSTDGDSLDFAQVGATSGASSTTYTDSGLSGDVRYFYRVRAQGGSGSPAPVVVSAVTRADAVRNLNLATLSTSQIVVNWYDASGETGYRIERSLNGTTWTTAGTVGVNIPMFSNTGLTAGTTYYYRVVTLDASGDAAVSSVASVATRLPAVSNLHFTSRQSTLMSIGWTAVTGANQYLVERSTDGTTYTTVATLGSTATSYTDNSVTALGAYYYRVTPIDAATAPGVASVVFAAAPAATPLPYQWQAQDIGVSNLGASGFNAATGTYTVVSNGSDIWNGSDQFRFTYLPLTGDGSIVAKVTAQSNTASWAKAGVMVRATLNANSAYAFAAVTPGNGAVFQLRTTAGGSASTSGTISGPAAPYWVRLTRSGNYFTAEVSADGANWSVVGNTSIAMAATVYIGLAADSYTTTTLNTTAFSNVAVNTFTNVAPQATVTASSQYSSTYVPAKAVDGIVGQAGTGEWASAGQLNPWVQLTWSAAKTINAVVLFDRPNTTDWAPGGTLTFSDGSSVPITGIPNNGSGLTASFAPRNVTSMRFQVAGGSGSNVGLSELMALNVTAAVPTVATAASASPSPVTGTTTSLSVLGADATGEANLYYTWSATSLPSGAAQPAFSDNGTNAAKNTTITFSQAGAYTLQATITNTYGLTATSSVIVTVSQTPTAFVVTPPAVILNINSTQQFTAYATDQFGQQIAGGISPTWSISPSTGAGTISAQGLYTAPGTQATATITAQSGASSASVAIQVYNLDVWTDAAGGSWTSAANWQNNTIASGAGVAADFRTLGLSAAATVTLDGARTVGDLLFGDTNNSYGWTLNTGAGGPLTLNATTGKPTIVVANQSATIGAVLAGSQGMVKTGGGTLILSAANTFSGGTTISQGTLESSNTAGAGAGTITLDDANSGNNSVSLLFGSGGSPANSIVVASQGTGTATIGTYGGSFTTFTGPVSLNRATTINDSTGDRTTINGLISGNVGTITVTGHRVTFGNAGNSFVGNLVINSGSTYQNDSAAALPTTTTMFDNGVFQVNNGGTHRIDALNGAGTVSIVAGGAATLSIGNQGGSGAFSGVIANNSATLSLIKTGSGTETLSGANTYTGTTTISGGVLSIANATGSGTGSGAVTVSSGGTLGGGGAISGAVTVNSGGTLTPGAGGIGTLTVSNTLALHGTAAMEITKTSGSPAADLVQGLTTVTYGGTLTVTNLGGTLTNGDTFTLFSATGFSGSFSTLNLPALGAGLHWDTTSLAINGSIKVVNNPPTVAAAASATPSPATGTITALAVLGADDGGEANLTYTWAATGTPPAAVNFSPNGSNSAKNATATFTAAGSYSFLVTIADQGGLTTTSTVNVTVNQTMTSIAVSPSSANLGSHGYQTYTATAYDQFGTPLAAQPTFAWSAANGTITSDGQYTAPYATNSDTVTAAAGGTSGTASVTVTNAAPTVTAPAAALPSPVTGAATALSVWGADSDGDGEAGLIYTWATTGTPPADVEFSANTSNAAKSTTATFTLAGDYSFMVTITDQGGQSTTSSVNVSVDQTVTSISVNPTSANITAGGTQQFAASAYDQFGEPIANQTFAWTIVTGTGSIDPASGLYIPPYAPGSATVQATANGVASSPASIIVTGQAQWNSSADASWNAAGSWADSISSAIIAAPGIREGIAGDTVLFAAATGGVARLDGASPILAGITFDSDSTSYTIDQGSGGDVTLQAGGGANVNVLSGKHTIGAPLVLAVNSTFNEEAGTRLTIDGNISGGGSFTKSGAGIVELSGANTFVGGEIVQSGKLIIDDASSLPNGGNLTVGDANFFGDPVVPAAIAASPQPATAALPVNVISVPGRPSTGRAVARIAVPDSVLAALTAARELSAGETPRTSAAGTGQAFLGRLHGSAASALSGSFAAWWQSNDTKIDNALIAQVALLAKGAAPSSI